MQRRAGTEPSRMEDTAEIFNQSPDRKLAGRKEKVHQGPQRNRQQHLRARFRPISFEIPDRTVMRRLVRQMDGLPKKCILTHHEEPNHHHLVSQYDDQYNRRGYNPILPPLRKWHGHKMAWVPEKGDFPLLEPPTNYGLFEQLVKKWTHKEHGLMNNSVYGISYLKPPANSYAVRQRPITTHILQANQEQWLPRSSDPYL